MRACKLETRKQGIYVLMAVLAIGFTGCATTKRAAQLAVDHHVGMVQGAWDIVSGEAEAREQRLAMLRTELEANRARIEAEPDPGRAVDLLKQQVALQDTLIAELMCGGHHGHGQQHARAETPAPPTHHHEAPANGGQ